MKYRLKYTIYEKNGQTVLTFVHSTLKKNNKTKKADNEAVTISLDCTVGTYGA